LQVTEDHNTKFVSHNHCLGGARHLWLCGGVELERAGAFEEKAKRRCLLLLRPVRLHLNRMAHNDWLASLQLLVGWVSRLSAAHC
jgi:hypothetical protein